MAKNGRRANGEGSYNKRPNGIWQVAVTVHLSDGSSKRLYHYAKTRQQCREWAEEIRAKEQAGDNSSWSGVTVLIDWLTEWRSKYCLNQRRSTLDSYDSYIERIGSSSLARVPLNRLNTQMLQEYALELMEHGRLDGNGGLSPKTIKNLFNMLHKSLKQAVGNKILSTNPVDFVQLPQAKRKQPDILSLDEVKALLQVSRDERYYAILMALIWTGMRLGEALSLRRSDFHYCEDADIYYLSVRHSLSRISNPDYDSTSLSSPTNRKTVLRISDTKTINGCRDIPLLPEVSKILKKYFQEQDKLIYELPGYYDTDPFIADNGINGGFSDPSVFRRWLKEKAEQAGIDKRCYPHLLRHGFGAMSAQNALDQKHLADLLGHADISFSSKIYQRTDVLSKAVALSKLEPLAASILS